MTKKSKKSVERKTEKLSEEREMERSMNTDLSNRHPTSPVGGGRAVPTTLPSVKQTEGKTEREMTGGG